MQTTWHSITYTSIKLVYCTPEADPPYRFEGNALSIRSTIHAALIHLILLPKLCEKCECLFLSYLYNVFFGHVDTLSETVLLQHMMHVYKYGCIIIYKCLFLSYVSNVFLCYVDTLSENVHFINTVIFAKF